MNRHRLRFLILGSALLVVSCANETRQAQGLGLGQQYYDENLSPDFNPVQAIHSESAQDFSTFVRQAQEVTKKSPSLKQQYADLYTKLAAWSQESGDPDLLAQYGVTFEQLGGADQHGNILFTGYFSPVIELRKQADDVFKYPLYAKPNCTGRQCPTRAKIYAGALEGQGLELGYAANLIDPFLMEVQGSGFVHYAGSPELHYFAYAGKNNHPYVSIGRILIERGIIPKEKMSMKAIKDWAMTADPNLLQDVLEENTSYVFFAPREEADVLGSAGIPLLPMAAVAGDRSLFPMGTPILAEVPLLDVNGEWTGVHVLKLLIVLDTGGAVKGGHLDLYHGVGQRAGVAAGHYKHFGRVWKLSENE